MFLIRRCFPLIIIFGILAYVIFFIEPPKSWIQASTFQILVFFIPLLLFFTFFINLFLKFWPKSFALGLGAMMLVVLRAVDLLSIVTFSLTLVASILLATSFKKPPLTRQPKIPKLKNIGKRT